MTEPETNFEVANNTGVEELRDELDSLRMLFSVTLILLVVFSLCLNAFLFKQCLVVNESKISVQQTANQTQNNLVTLWTKLNEFSKTHPDITPMLDKYRIYFNTNAPAAGKK